MDEGKSVDVAFDKVSHRLLKMKLKAYGIGGRLLAWIEAWLADRKHRVVVGDAKSAWLEVGSGTTQRFWVFSSSSFTLMTYLKHAARGRNP